jgi:hypothetical protein
LFIPDQPFKFCKNNLKKTIYAKLLRNNDITLHYQNEKTNGI